MDELLLQGKVLLISVLGFVAILPGPKKDGELRIKGPLNNIISYMGIILRLGPWVALPFLPQPRFIGPFGTAVIALGYLLLLSGVAFYAFSLRALLPAFKTQFSEFTPEALITGGTYKLVRHPIYLSSLLILLGLDMTKGATLSVLFIPLSYLVFRLVAYYEERRILAPRFGQAYEDYKSRTRAAITGVRKGLLLAGVYVILAAPSVMSLMGVGSIPFIE